MKRGEERAYNLERLKKEQEMRRVFEFVNFLTTGGYFCDDTLPENVILEHIKKNLSPEMLEYLGASEYPATLDEFLNICATKLIGDIKLAQIFRDSATTYLHVANEQLKKYHPSKNVSGSVANKLNSAVYKFLQKQNAVPLDISLPQIHKTKYNLPRKNNEKNGSLKNLMGKD